jgi:pilus assembly protein CpaC
MIAFVGASIVSATTYASLQDQVLIKGQSDTIIVNYEIGDVAVADPKVCDYLVGKGRGSLYINAKDSGETSITLWDADGAERDNFSVKVVTTTLKDILDKVKRVYGSMDGVDVEIRNGRVEANGEVVDPYDFREIESLSRSESKFRSQVRLSDNIIGKIRHAIKRAVAIPGITVESFNDKIVLSGVAYNSTDKMRAFEIAKIYYSDVLDLVELKDTGRLVGRGDLIELEFHMMEIKRSALRQLGINWAPGATQNDAGANAAMGGGAGVLSSVADVGRSLLGFVFQLAPKLRIIRENGNGRVLERPSIVVKSGEKAGIFSGSEVPYYNNDEVQFKKVGIDIEAEPIRVGDGIDLRIKATLSAPSGDIRGAVDTHTVATTAVLPLGQSLVLSNIIRNGDVKMKNRVPGNIDSSSALFTLFLSKDFQSNRSEFLIFVTPRVLKQPKTAESDLVEYKNNERTMIRERSKKEYEKYLSKYDLVNEKKRLAPKRINKYSRERLR